MDKVTYKAKCDALFEKAKARKIRRVILQQKHLSFQAGFVHFSNFWSTRKLNEIFAVPILHFLSSQHIIGLRFA